MEIVNYQPGKISKIDDMKPAKSIGDLIKKNADPKTIQAAIITIAAKYLSLNAKGKAITNEAGFLLISEFIMDECPNLELQEIEYIFKRGVMGRFGEIYNDISIDTICGKNGWIETYYKTDRMNKPERVILDGEVYFTGNEISEEEFMKRYPEYKERAKMRQLLTKAQERKATVSDLKEFYKIKGFKPGDMQEDIAALTRQYEISQEKEYIQWPGYLSNWINGFIVQNFYKVKG